MKFFPRKHRRPPAIIIVALIDVLLVVLIFLVVTTTFKQQPALQLSLPESSRAQAAGQGADSPVIISVDKEGLLYLGANPAPMDLDTLQRLLTAMVRDNPDLHLALSVDKAATVGRFIEVQDVATAAGVNNEVIVHTRKAQ